jgi:hypothetical protein
MHSRGHPLLGRSPLESRLIESALRAENHDNDALRGFVQGAATMSLGVSIFLLVVGAILTFAVDVTTSGFSPHTVGTILMVAGPVKANLAIPAADRSA